MPTPSKTDRFVRLGFDRTENVRFTSVFKVRCSQCEALVINGIPTHETGCPNAKSECRGCGEIVEKGVRYCEDCA